MADPDKALRQGVKQKAADELHGADGGLPDLVSLSILVPETDLALLQLQKATVGDRHPVGVSGQILKDVLGLLNGIEHMDHPLVPVKL